MSDHIQKTIDDALIELRKQEEAVLTTKRLINHLCTFGKISPMFPNLDEAPSTQQPTGVRRNSFYGQPLAKCVRLYLEWRKASGIPKEASLDEIMTALKDGGFELSAVSRDEDGQKRGVAISLAKNSVTFHKLPSGDFGLMEWYPNIRAKREKVDIPSESVHVPEPQNETAVVRYKRVAPESTDMKGTTGA